MGLRNRMYLLTSIEEVDQFLERFPTSALFKAGSCRQTGRGFKLIEQALDPHDQLFLAFIRTDKDEAVCHYIAEKTSVVHQTPQLILLVNGKAVYDIDHWNITQEAVEVALERYLGRLDGQKFELHRYGDEASALVPILEGLVKGKLGEQDFRQQWDALPRVNPFFCQLIGDFEATLAGQCCQSAFGCSSLPLAPRQEAQIKIKAGQLLALLKAYQ